MPIFLRASLVNDSMHESPILGNPYTMDMTISERVRVQHATPPRDIAWLFVPNGAHWESNCSKVWITSFQGFILYLPQTFLLVWPPVIQPFNLHHGLREGLVLSQSYPLLVDM
jgi:hypothetical protein